jgi:transposase InsO family protein
MRFQFIRRHAQQFRVNVMCNVLQVSRGGYYAWCNRRPSAREEANQRLLALLRRLFALNHKRYGYRRIHHVARQEIPCGRHRVARLMRQDGLKVPQRRTRWSTTQSKHKRPVPPNILGRAFTVEVPNHTWLSDLTYVPTEQGWLYLAVVLDMYARRVVGWAMESNLADTLTRKALKMAVRRRQPAPALLHHSDRGIQYASLSYRNLLVNSKAAISMSRKGDVLDNAPVESFFATLKKELIHRCHYQTRREAKSSIFEYIEGFYNPIRIHSSIQYYSPVAYETLNFPP